MHPMPMQTHTRLRPPDGLRRRLRAAAGLLTDNRSMQQLILLRWIAVFGQLLVIGMIHVWAGISLPLHTMLSIAGGQALFNVFSVYYWRQHSDVSERALLLSFLTDVAALTAQLYLSGGLANPFMLLYLLQIVLAAVLLQPRSGWLVTLVSFACMAALAVWHGPIELPANPAAGLANPYVQGLLLCFVLVAGLLVVFIGRIGSILRERDARLAGLRQRAAEEEHIVRMGLLASGAAHELGTPLSTLAVILGDWQHLPHFTSDPELLQDVSEMQTQVLRCKAIVTGILHSAGETRAESPHEMSLSECIDEMVDIWRRSRLPHLLSFDNRINTDLAIIADTGLQQMLFNVMDNAMEASPRWLSLEAECVEDMLVLQVSDNGPGFRADMLERLGKPFQSSKDVPGRGLGLFLSFNVARAFGGSIHASNKPAGGARVTITLPLHALTADADPYDD